MHFIYSVLFLFMISSSSFSCEMHGDFLMDEIARIEYEEKMEELEKARAERKSRNGRNLDQVDKKKSHFPKSFLDEDFN